MTKQELTVKGYQVEVFYSKEDVAYIADVPALGAFSAFGDTPEDAIREIGIALEGLMEALRDEEFRKNDPHNEIKELVRERYGAVAQQVIGIPLVGHNDCEVGVGCGEGGCCDAPDNDHALRLYASGELEGLPAEAMAASLGCGNPTALAGLQPGERVLDLGSGGGIDCFLAARQVGAAGRVTGLDMTPYMIDLAMQNGEKLGLQNVEFVQGEMERMPLPDGAYDVIISNCVVNLSPDKDAVFSESFRVLAPGGRIHLSDILALTPDGPAATNPDAWVTCIAGAEYREVYLERLQRAGFADIEITNDGGADLSACPPPTNTASFLVTARKPA